MKESSGVHGGFRLATSSPLCNQVVAAQMRNLPEISQPKSGDSGGSRPVASEGAASQSQADQTASAQVWNLRE